MAVDLLQPACDVIERIFSSAVVHKNYSHGSFIVSLSNGPETLLAGCIPDLHFYLLPIDWDSLDFEINS